MIKVALRRKSISNGRLTLFLDFWPPIARRNGKETRREYLRLYVWEKPRTALERIHNKETESLAETIRSRRQIDVQSAAYGMKIEGADMPLCDFIEEQIKRRTGTSQASWRNMTYHIRNQKFYSFPLSQIDVSHCLKFRSFLVDKVNKKELKASTAHGYLAYFRTAMRFAYKSGLIAFPANLFINLP